MSAAVLAPASDVRPGEEAMTLGDTLERAWDAIRVEGSAECPVCGGAMAASGAAARCGDCGSSLS